MPCREGWHITVRLHPNCFKALVALMCCRDVCVYIQAYMYMDCKIHNCIKGIAQFLLIPFLCAAM